MRLVIMFLVALFLIDAALLGNIGALLGSIIDPANMIEKGTGTGTATASKTGAKTG